MAAKPRGAAMNARAWATTLVLATLFLSYLQRGAQAATLQW